MLFFSISKTWKVYSREMFRCLTILAIFTIQQTNAQVATYSNEFLNIGIDAASLSKGNSVVASIDGICAGYWNPAGIVQMNREFEASVMHANYFSGMAQYDYAGFGYRPTDSLALGFSIIRFGVDDIPNTLNLVDENGNINYDRITYFSVADYAFLFSLSRKSKIPGIDWGANLKIIYRRQGNFAKAFGFGFDIGAQYSRNKWKFGAMLRDVSSTFNIWIFNKELFEEVYIATGNELPENNLELTIPKLLIGVSYHFNISAKILAQTEIGLDCYFDGKRNSLISSKVLNIDPHFGFQVSYLKNIHLRAGIDHFQLIDDFDKNNKLMFQSSMGIGFCLYDFSLDYALTDVGDMSIAPISHIFSIKYSFGKPIM